jgi:hypothetical protein
MKGDECLADIDIDEAGGFEHIFEVVQHAVTSDPTHPYDVHEILVFRQKIDPGYSFQI